MASRLPHQAVLTGSGTMLAAAADAGDPRPLLVIVDGQGRVTWYAWLREQPFWRQRRGPAPSHERTVAAAGRSPRIQPIAAHLLPAARLASGIISQRTGRQRERRAAGARGRKAQPEVRSNLRSGAT